MIDPLKAFHIDRASRLALVGAGGKTRLMFHLGRAGQSAGLSPILATTTHLGSWQVALADVHRQISAPDGISPGLESLPPGLVLVTGPQAGANRVSGLQANTLKALLGWANDHQVPLLIEADGARQRNLKAPAAHEPAIPPFANAVAVLAGMEAIGKALSDAEVHRSEIFAILTGLSSGEKISIAEVARLLCHPEGGLRNIPAEAARMAVLMQANNPQRRSQASALAAALLPVYPKIIVADLPEIVGRQGQAGIEPERAGGIHAVHVPVAGIILAAGGSTRFGDQPKQLALWRGEPLVRHVVRAALAAGLDQVVVVTGAWFEAVESALQELPVDLARNPNWEAGQSGSVHSGLEALSGRVGAALFLLADQPQVPSTLIQALVDAHRSSLSPLVAPQIDGQRGNPVLFDRETFPELLRLTGDTGGRALFSKYPVKWVPWHDPRPLWDIDTIDDLERLKGD